MAELITPSDVVAFWKEAGPDKWYAKDERFDATVRERMRAAHWNAAARRLDDWMDTAQGALALLIVLDQYPRNSFRGTAHQFATDALGLCFAKTAIARGWPAAYEPDLRQFFYVPYEHSERLSDHDELVPLLGDDMPEVKRYAIIHRDIIVRFGRFPHRNTVLGRETTVEEAAFLQGGGFAG
ncbi:MAG: DUF924 family protein [Brevundimonas sp.]|nr:MAG: DUF924 family protein [Brevundimonas sp.]